MAEDKKKDPELGRRKTLVRALSRKGKTDKEKKRLSLFSNKSKESVNSTGSPRPSIEQNDRKEKKKEANVKADKEVKQAKDVKDVKQEVIEPVDDTKIETATDAAETETDTDAGVDAPVASKEIEAVTDEPIAAVAAEVPKAPTPEEVPEVSEVPEVPAAAASSTASAIAPVIASASSPKSVSPTHPPSLSPTSKQSPIPVADERQPLLPQDDITATSNYLSSPKLSIGLILLVIIVLIVFFFVYHGYSVDIQQSIHPQLSAISLVGINDLGLKVRISCSVSVDYNVSSIIFHNLYKAFGVLVGPVLISPYNPIGVMVNDLDSFNVTSPPFTLLLHNNAYNELEFETTVDVNDSSLIKLLNELANNDEVEVNLKSVFYTDFSFRHLSLHHMKFDIDQDLIFNNNLSSNLDIQNTVMKYDSDSLFFTGDIGYFTYYVKDFLSEFNDYDLALNCGDKWSKIGSLEITTHDKFFSANATIDELNKPDPECVSQLIEDYAKGKSCLFVNCKNKTKYKWLSNILGNVYFKAPFIPLRPISVGFDEINNSLIDIEISDTLKGQITKTIEGPNIEVDSVIGIPEYDLSVSSSSLIRNGILVEQFEIGDYDGIGDFLNIFLCQELTKIKVESFIKKMVLNSKIKADDLYFNDTVSIVNNFDVNKINASVLVDTIILTELNPESLNLQISASVDFGNIKLDIQHPLELELVANKSFGTIKLPSFKTLEPVQLDLTIHKQNEQELTTFVNKFISRIDQTIDTKFVDGIFDSVAFNDINLPSLQFQEGTKTFNSFILSSTIHMLTSEVELMILNPIMNHEINVELQDVIAVYEGQIIGELGKPQNIMLPGGVSKVDKIPIKLNRIGADIVRKALNGKLNVTVTANFKLYMQYPQFELQLQYTGDNLDTEIRL